MPVFTFPDGHVSFPDYVRTTLRLTFKRQPIMLLALVPMLPGLYVLYALLSGQATAQHIWRNGTPVSLLMATFVVVLPGLWWWGLRKQYNASPSLLNSACYTLSEASFTVQNTLVQEEFSWAAVQEAWLIGSWLVLLTSHNVGYFLDLRRVQAPATVPAVLQLLRENAVPVK